MSECCVREQLSSGDTKLKFIKCELKTHGQQVVKYSMFSVTDWNYVLNVFMCLETFVRVIHGKDDLASKNDFWLTGLSKQDLLERLASLLFVLQILS